MDGNLLDRYTLNYKVNVLLKDGTKFASPTSGQGIEGPLNQHLQGSAEIIFGRADEYDEDRSPNIPLTRISGVSKQHGKIYLAGGNLVCEATSRSDTVVVDYNGYHIPLNASNGNTRTAVVFPADFSGEKGTAMIRCGGHSELELILEKKRPLIDC